MGNKIGGDQATLALLGGEVGSRTVQAHPKRRRFHGRKVLGQQRSNHTAENIPHTTAGHTGVTVITQRHVFTIKNQTAVPFQDHDTTIAHLQATDGSKPICLHLDSGTVEHARGLTRVRRQYPQTGTADAGDFFGGQ